MIELRKITSDNFDECVKLDVNEDQKTFVATNLKSIAQAYVALTNNECIPMPYALYEGENIIGFAMFAFCEPDEDFNENSYWVWRFMIDKAHQGKGYGKEAMKKSLELIKTFPHGEASTVFLSYEPENVVAKKLYASVGFEETGKIVDGEMLAKLVL